MQTKYLELLKEEFNRIIRTGYVKSGREGYTGIGKTFEDLLGKAEDTKDTPDYHGIEIKTKLGYSNSYTTLFNLTPNGKLETQRLTKKYGYPDRVLKDKKVLNISITSNPTLVANKFYFNLKVDYTKKKVLLIIKDSHNNLLEDKIYWSFESLEEKLVKKLQYLALVNAWPIKRNGFTYYKYYQMKFYKLRSFNQFIDLIESGMIRVSIKVGVFRDGIKKGMPHDRGTSFELKTFDFYNLFEPIYI